MSESPSRTRQQRARKHALNVLFEAAERRVNPDEVLARREPDDAAPRELTLAIVQGVSQHYDALRDRVSEHLGGGWTWDRMPALDRTLALMGAWELIYGDTPTGVVVNEVKLLAEEHSTESSAGFLVGVLSSLGASMAP